MSYRKSRGPCAFFQKMQPEIPAWNNTHERFAAQHGIFSIPRFDFNGQFTKNGATDLSGFREAIKKTIATGENKA